MPGTKDALWWLNKSADWFPSPGFITCEIQQSTSHRLARNSILSVLVQLFRLPDKPPVCYGGGFMAKFERLEKARTHTNVISRDLSQNARPIHICNNR